MGEETNKSKEEEIVKAIGQLIREIKMTNGFLFKISENQNEIKKYIIETSRYIKERKV